MIKGNQKFPLPYINLGLVYDVLIILGVIVEFAMGQHSKCLYSVAILQSPTISIIAVDILYYKQILQGMIR